MEKLINKELGDKNLIYLKCADFNIDTCTLSLNFSYPASVTQELKKKVYDIVIDNVPDYVAYVEINIVRLYFDDLALAQFVKTFLSNSYPAVYAAISDNIEVERVINCYRISIDCDKDVFFYVEKYNVALAVLDALKNEFRENFNVKFNKSDVIKPEDVVVKKPEDDGVSALNKRLINVTDILPVIGTELGTTAFYISDIKMELSPCIICGKISNLNKRFTKSEKLMYTFTLSDFTGKMRCLSFPSKKNTEKMDCLKDGDDVIVGGSSKEDKFGGGFCVMVSSISSCKLPLVKDFKIETYSTRKESELYKTVEPKNVMQIQQECLFEVFQDENKYFKDKVFVAFDIETTGLKVEENDKITEIGAVKIFNGVIVEKFSTLIDPEVNIPDSITKLTGITDEMVKGKPKIEDVIPDFYKFTRGCVLVAHNIDFDFKFIQSFAKLQGFSFDNEMIDTVSMGRTKLPGLSNYKLHTLANALKIPLLNHHRAVDDAICCAEIFIKLNA